MEEKKETKEKLLAIINACIYDSDYFKFDILKGGYIKNDRINTIVSPYHKKSFRYYDFLVLKFDDSSEITVRKEFKCIRKFSLEEEVIKKFFFTPFQRKEIIEYIEKEYEYVITFNDSCQYSIANEEAIEIIRIFKENKKAYDDSRVENSIDQKFNYFNNLRKD